MVADEWRERAARMGRTTARLLKEGYMPEVQVWTSRTLKPTRDPCITCGDALDLSPEAVEVFAADAVRLLFHRECYDVWVAFRQRHGLGEPPEPS